MEQITVSFPDRKIRDFINEVVASGSYNTPDEYLLALVNEDRKRRAKTKLSPFSWKVWKEIGRSLLTRIGMNSCTIMMSGTMNRLTITYPAAARSDRTLWLD